MKQLKFRCWDKKDNRWVSPDKFSITGNGRILLKVFPWHGFIKLSQENCEIPQFIRELQENLEITQFTGYQDINGVNIYEGDIVRAEIGKHEFKFLIEFDLRDENNHYYGGFWFREYYPSELLVMGNKFENPELWESLQ